MPADIYFEFFAYWQPKFILSPLPNDIFVEPIANCINVINEIVCLRSIEASKWPIPRYRTHSDTHICTLHGHAVLHTYVSKLNAICSVVSYLSTKPTIPFFAFFCRLTFLSFLSTKPTIPFFAFFKFLYFLICVSYVLIITFQAAIAWLA